MGPAFSQGKAGSLRLWMQGEIGGGRRKEACALAGRKVLALNFGHGPVPVDRAFAPIGEGRNAACCGRRPLCLRGAVRLGRRVPVGEGPRSLLMFTKRGTCDSGVRHRTRLASTRGGPVVRGARRLRMGYAMMC